MKLAEAIELMRKAFPGKYRAIGLDTDIHDESTDVKFSAWNGHDHFYGATLEAAVNSCLIDAGEFTGSTEEASRIMREARRVSGETLIF